MHTLTLGIKQLKINLGVILETGLSFSSHVTKSAYHLTNIARIRCFVSSQDLEDLVHHQQVDYCNGLLPQKSIIQLQLIQNTAARILTRTRTSESSEPYTGFQLHLGLILKYFYLYKPLNGLDQIHCRYAH